MAVPVIGPYLEILSTRSGWRFSVAAWFGRIMRSTAGIGAILLVAAGSDNYALAGAVSGCVVVGSALSGTLWSRAADSRGQTAVLPWAIAASIASAAALLLVVELDAPPATWFIAAFLVGASAVDAGSLARARWVHLLPTPERRHTALALEAVGDEFTFVVGPPFVTLLAGLVNPAFGFAVGIGVSVLGLSALLAQRATAPVPAPMALARRAFLPLTVLALLPAHVGIGLVFGSVDITAVGISDALGSPAVAGILLAVFAVGSVTSGLLFGSVSARWRPRPRLAFASLAFGAVAPTFLLSTDVVAFAIVSFAVGLTMTPVLISASSLIESTVDRAGITAAMAWPNVALSLGVTIGASTAGAGIDAEGAWAGLGVTAVAGILVGVTGLANAALRR